MGKLTGTQYAEKWANRLKSASDAITTGVAAVTISPTISAAAKQDKMRANIIKSIDNGKWAAGLKKVTLAEWQAAMTERGIPRIAAGVDAAQSDMASFGEELMAYQTTLSAKIDKMPDVTLEDNLARMTEQVRGMAKFSRKS
jgi:hypothetical protein